jgi:hypothetical protein
MVALLTPVVKAFLTDNGYEIAPRSACRCYGGHGYIHEWGMEQYVRDARINMIYEGTNTDPIARPAGPQGAGRQWCQADEVRQADRRLRRGRGHQ